MRRIPKYFYIALNNKLNPTKHIFILRPKMMGCPLTQNIPAKNKPLKKEAYETKGRKFALNHRA